MAALPNGPLPPGPWVEPDLFDNRVQLAGTARPTSVYAARLTLPKTGTKRFEVLRLIAKSGESGFTDEELQGFLGWNLNTVRPRRLELVQDGWIEDSGLRRPTELGMPSIVWRLTQRGYDRWFQL